MLALFVTVVLISPQKARASHAAGAEIIYVQIGKGDSTYQFFFKFYRDCKGIPEPDSVQMCFHNTCTNQTFTRWLKKWSGTLPPNNDTNGHPVSLGCSNSKTNCDSPTSKIPGYQEWWYSTFETLPLKCNSWKFSVSISARNTPQTNITGGNLYVETIFNANTKFGWDNSSPYYSVKPIPYVCLNNQYIYNNGALDQDGDSLWSEMIRPLNAGSCSATPQGVGLINQTPPISWPTNPLQTNGSFSLNNFNGQMSFIAQQFTGAATITIKTHEYRDGIEIGSIMRDVQIQVIACNTVIPSVKPDTGSLDTAGWWNNKYSGCVDQTMKFCFDIKSNDKDAVLKASDNLKQSLPGTNAKLTYSNIGHDSIRCCFEWTPEAKHAGNNYSFIVTTVDSTCKPPGILFQYPRTIDLYVWPPVEVGPDTSVCDGQPAFLSANGGDQYEWSILSGTPNSLSCLNCKNPVARPLTTSVYRVKSNVNDYCDNNKDTIEITVLHGPSITGQNDTIACPGNPTQLDIHLVKETGVKYDIKWTPATGLSSDTISNPVMKVRSDITYTVSVGSSENQCVSGDTINVDVLDGFTLENPDTSICIGETVTVRGTSDNRYAYSWESSDGTPSYSNPADLHTTVTPSDTGKYYYRLVGRYTGCPDSIAEFDITVDPIPEVTVDNDAQLCNGDTMKLHGIVTPLGYSKYTYDWSPGASLDFPDKVSPIFQATKEGVVKLTLTVKTPAGCTDSDDVELTVFSADFINLPPDTVMCPGDTILIDMVVDGKPQFYWTPDFNISSISSQNPKVWPVANQRYTVYGKDETGCLDTASINVDVRPGAILDLPDSVILYAGESFRLDPGGNCLYYSWFPPLGLSRADIADPVASPKVNTRYVVKARTAAGCVLTDSVDILVEPDGYVKLPNAFTPGGHNNNVLTILKRGEVELKKYVIYNRWGGKVFETTNIDEGWDGRYNGEVQPMGVYIYTIEAVTPSGRTIHKQGNVTLVR